ncbi:hypothetical protein A6A27_25555 [Micromonospora sp. CB01531]|nr:hypothetical protein A6A27_25555 [Micromonospora sp. CB01531]
MLQHGQALRAVLGGVAGGDGDHGDTGLGGEVPHAVDDLSADLLGQARVQGGAHAPCFQRAQVFQIDDGRPGGDRLVDGPTGGSPGDRVVQVLAAFGDVADLVPQDRMLADELMALVDADEPLVVVDLGVQPLTVTA